MKKIIIIGVLMLLTATSPVVSAQGHFWRQIVLIHNVGGFTPPIVPLSLDNPLPCDIEAYQTEDGVEIIVNDVSLSGLYQISVFNHRLDIVYNTSVLFYDGASTFITTATWPDDTYYLQIIIPGGWLEGEFEIED